MTPVVIGDATLYCGDCMEILPTLPKVDAVITDPPYGVGFKYESHDDTHIGYVDWCKSWFLLLQQRSTTIAVSCGISNIQDWPKPNWTLCWHKPASMGRCSVGFNNWEPVLLYGKARKQIVDVFRATIVPDDSLAGHPCPKPLMWAVSLVDALSNQSQSVLDPFMGSGTTGVACAQMGRAFIGIEREPKYFDIACRRIDDAYRQQPLIPHQAPKAEQQELL
jgi:site-specific DNA-methyltransferase (adenine-specific)